MTLSLPPELLRKYRQSWIRSESSPEMTLLRIELLRKLAQDLHSETSKYLARGSRSQTEKMMKLESQVEKLRDSLTLDGELAQLIQQRIPSSQLKKKVSFPKNFFKKLEQTKLLRQDRKWEASLAAEAARFGWQLWSLTTWVCIPEIEKWDRALSKKLWPKGLILFTEISSMNRDDLLQMEKTPPLWRGRWHLLVKPKAKPTAKAKAKPIAEPQIDLMALPGNPTQAPHPAEWELLYP